MKKETCEKCGTPYETHLEGEEVPKLCSICQMEKDFEIDNDDSDGDDDDNENGKITFLKGEPDNFIFKNDDGDNNEEKDATEEEEEEEQEEQESNTLEEEIAKTEEDIEKMYQEHKEQLKKEKAVSTNLNRIFNYLINHKKQSKGQAVKILFLYRNHLVENDLVETEYANTEDLSIIADCAQEDWDDFINFYFDVQEKFPVRKERREERKTKMVKKAADLFTEEKTKRKLKKN